MGNGLGCFTADIPCMYFRDSNTFYLRGSKTPTEGNRINAFEDIYTGSTGRLQGKG